MIGNLAREQALLLRKSREVTREPHAKRDVSAKGWRKKGVLLFLLSSRWRLFLRLALLATRNRELKLKQENLSISKILSFKL